VTIRILLADDHEIVREGFRAAVDREDDMVVVAEADDGEETVRLTDEHDPDVVVVDIGMPVLNGIEATRRIRREHPEVRVIALSVHDESQYVTEMLKAGARGYLVKTCAMGELVGAIRAVYAGETYLSSKVAGAVVSQAVGQREPDADQTGAPLSPREREVLALLVDGKSSKEIARDLHVTARTVDLHRQNIMKKLELYSVAELTKYAIRQGLTDLD
jgi:DNA-binding NarL/FixJ family response regulator